MALAQRIESLEHQHAVLKAAVHAAEMRPYEDAVELKTLKLKKLHVKEELAQLTSNSNSNTKH